MKIVQLFNSSVVSGPENLILRNLANSNLNWELWNLEENRLCEGKENPLSVVCSKLGVRYRGFAVNSRWDLETVHLLSKSLEQENIEIAHAHDVKASTYLWRSKNKNLKIVSTHHGVFGRPDLKSRLFEIFYRFIVLSNFKKIFAVSKEDEKVLKKIHGSRVSLLRNAIPVCDDIQLKSLQARKPEIRKNWAERLGVSEDLLSGTVLGFVGRLSAEKNPHFAVSVAALGDWPLIIFGDGDLRESIARSIHEKGLSKKVFCLGYDKNIFEQYPGFDVLLSVSDAEGLPLNLLECASLEVPYLAKAVGGIPELSGTAELQETLVNAKESPEVFSSSLKKSASSKQHLSDLGQRFRKHIQLEFSSEAWIQRLVSHYQDLKEQGS